MKNKTLTEKLKSARVLLVYTSLIVLLFIASSFNGYRLLDVFGTEQWEQDGPGTHNNYHK